MEPTTKGFILSLSLGSSPPEKYFFCISASSALRDTFITRRQILVCFKQTIRVNQNNTKLQGNWLFLPIPLEQGWQVNCSESLQSCPLLQTWRTSLMRYAETYTLQKSHIVIICPPGNGISDFSPPPPCLKSLVNSIDEDIFTRNMAGKLIR